MLLIRSASHLLVCHIHNYLEPHEQPSQQKNSRLLQMVDKARLDRLGALVVFLCGNLWTSEAFSLTPPVALQSTLSFVRQPTRVFFKPDDEFKDLMEEMEAEKEAKAQAEAAALEEEEESVEDISQAQHMAAFLSARLGAAFIKAQQQKKTESTVTSYTDKVDEKEEHISASMEEEEPVTDEIGEPLVPETVEEKTPSVAPVSNEEPALDEEKKPVVINEDVGQKLVPEVVEKKPIVVEEVAIPKEEEKKPVEMIEDVGEKLVPEVVQEKKPELVPAAEDESAVEEKIVKTKASSEEVTGEDEEPGKIEEEETENPIVAEEESEVPVEVEEHCESLHKREGDRIVALKDEFSTYSLPEAVSIEFGRPLEVVQSGLPPLSEKELADITNASAKVAKATRSALEGTATFVETEFISAPKVLPSLDEVPSELDDIEQAEALEGTATFGETELSVDEEPSELPVLVDDSEQAEEPDNAIQASEEVVQLERLMEKSKPEELTLEDQAFNILVELGMIKLTPDPNSPAYDHSADNEYCSENVYTNFDESLLTTVGAVSESKMDASETETILPSSDVVVERVEVVDLDESVDVAKEESSSNSRSLRDRAFDILLSLGMIKVNPDPNSPDYDHSTDNDYCPENVYANFDLSRI